MFKLKEKIQILQLNYKKELTKIIFLNLLLLIAIFIGSYLMKNFNFVLPSCFLLFVFNYAISFSYDKKISTLKSNNEHEFIVVLNYIQTFLENNFNVYKSIEETIPFCSNFMKEKLGELLSNIDGDKTIAPFITFAQNFNSSLIEQVMIVLFLMVDNGSSKDYLLRFTPLFEQLQKENKKNLSQKLSNHYDTLNLLPVVGSAIVTVIIITGIVGIIGGVLNGI